MGQTLIRRRLHAKCMQPRTPGHSLEHVANLQIRNVPEDVHRELKARAASEGRSLSEYALAELRRSIERPTRGELLDRIERRGAARTSVPLADAVRAERDAR